MVEVSVHMIRRIKSHGERLRGNTCYMQVTVEVNGGKQGWRKGSKASYGWAVIGEIREMGKEPDNGTSKVASKSWVQSVNNTVSI